MSSTSRKASSIFVDSAHAKVIVILYQIYLFLTTLQL